MSQLLCSDKEQHNALHFCLINESKNEHTENEIIQNLIQHGADVNAHDAVGSTPLHYAANRNAGVIRTLLEKGANPLSLDNNGNMPIHVAVSSDNEYAIRVLSLHSQDFLKQYNAAGLTPLHCAIKYANSSTLKFLIEFGKVDISKPDQRGRIPIAYAIKCKNYFAVDLLAQHKANLNIVDQDGNTLLHNAIRNKDNKLVDILLAN